MLVVVHHRYRELFTQPAFNLKTFRGFYVLKVDSAECRGYGLYYGDEFFGVFFINFDIETVKACKNLEQQGFPFHHRFSGKRSDIS